MYHFSFEISIETNEGISFYTFTEKDSCAFFDFNTSFQDNRLIATIIPKTKFRVLSTKTKIPMSCEKNDRILLNGYQSWTDTRELTLKDRLVGINSIPKKLAQKYGFENYGDYPFVKYSGKKGELHGFTFGYIRQDNIINFVGSLDESKAYTILKYSGKKQLLSIEKDCYGLEIIKDLEICDVALLSGEYDYVFDKWFEMQEKYHNFKKTNTKPMCGYTSWYRHYENISEDTIKNDLAGVLTLPQKIDIFQIDDGYETAVGDWLSIDEKKFPKGIKNLCDEIHSQNILAGLWLAPFVCETKSEIFKNHKDWLRKDDNGNFVKCGSNWSGFYALDLYNPEVIRYLEKVFDTVLNQWGFDMVKLDFLYAADRVPTKEKTRGQQMWEAMELLRRLCGNKLILGCGVPLAPAFGKVDFCRIGCDVSLDWNDKLFMRFLHRERISTRNTICDSIYRRGLNNRAFLNDPDVFLLRDNNIKLSKKQKLQLATVNGLFGSLWFTSDDCSLYSPEKIENFSKVLKLHNAKNLKVSDNRKSIFIEYNLEEKKEKLCIKL